MKKSKLNTPILYLVFNRLEATKKSFGVIKKVRPKQLFVGADGPRFPEEKKKTDAVRDFILKNIDWECDVRLLFWEKNMDQNPVVCNPALTGAFRWFFDNVEEGIILEDDCLPSESFFRFCQEMLEKYRDDKKVGFIAGFSNKKRNIKESYYFSEEGFTWGWAIWKDRFEKYYTEKPLPGLKKLKVGKNVLERMFHRQSMLFSFKRVGGWDCRIQYHRQLFGDFIIVPKLSLIGNVGWGDVATHTIEHDGREKINIGSLKFPLKHPKQIKAIHFNDINESKLFFLKKAIHLFLRRYYFYIFKK